MDQDALLEHWRRAKATPQAGARYRLTAPYEQSFIFRGPDWGHPSNYAAVRFRCAPDDTVSLHFAAAWPEALDSPECRAVERAIACGVVDGLLGAALLPSWACALTLIEVGWDDVMSSEVAFYRAAKAAMGELIAHGPWQRTRA